MAAQVWFGADELDVLPGQSTSLSLSIENVGDTTETFTVIPSGLAAAWTTVTRTSVTLFAGSRDVIEVVVRPPAIHSTSAGPTGIAVRVIPQANPDEAVIAETIVEVEPFDDRRVTMLQPLQRSRRRATYEFMVENHGNNLASCRLHLIDPSNRVDGSFSPPAVGVAPGASSLVRLKLKAARGLFRGSERQLDFEIEATEPSHEPAIGRATLIRPATVPARIIAQVGLLALIVGALIGAWFGVIRPELRDAAERAVDERIDEFVVTAPTVVVTPETSVPDDAEASAPTADAPVGTPETYRVEVDVAIGQQRSESLAVPPDSEYHLTDVVLQNPNGDLGSAALLRNDEVLYEWDLGRMSSTNEFQARVSPIPFKPGDNLVFSVDCDAAGHTTSTGCDVAVLLGGLLLPSPQS